MIEFKNGYPEKNISGSIEKLIKNTHTKNEGSQTIILAVITPTTLKNSTSINTRLKY